MNFILCASQSHKVLFSRLFSVISLTALRSLQYALCTSMQSLLFFIEKFTFLSSEFSCFFFCLIVIMKRTKHCVYLVTKVSCCSSQITQYTNNYLNILLRFVAIIKFISSFHFRDNFIIHLLYVTPCRTSIILH